MLPEEKASEEVRLGASSLKMRLFRNNRGALKSPDGRFVRFGLANESKKINESIKSHDYIGIKEIKITKEMVGKSIGVFVSIEAKPEDFIIKDEYPEKSREHCQKKWELLIKRFGGMSGFATCAQDVRNIFNNFITELKK